mmetsp:Transcript_16934/g.49336  ORF Transcript_16934/g.49336 Transcript_16934/m.49336 type:complete len:259 (+) Transcript_16934:284-1060(+)
MMASRMVASSALLSPASRAGSTILARRSSKRSRNSLAWARLAPMERRALATERRTRASTARNFCAGREFAMSPRQRCWSCWRALSLSLKICALTSRRVATSRLSSSKPATRGSRSKSSAAMSSPSLMDEGGGAGWTQKDKSTLAKNTKSSQRSADMRLRRLDMLPILKPQWKRKRTHVYCAASGVGRSHVSTSVRCTKHWYPCFWSSNASAMRRRLSNIRRQVRSPTPTASATSSMFFRLAAASFFTRSSRTTSLRSS